MPASALLLSLVLFGTAAAWAEEVEVPPLGLLEYLGEWEDRDGQGLDPQLLQLLMPRGEEQVNEEDKDE